MFGILSIVNGQNNLKMPHGTEFDLACKTCHTTDSWKIDYSRLKFNHSQTGFTLIGQHQQVSCRSCHQSLEFNKIGSSCADCHTDIHKNRLGKNCEQCHSPQGWEDRSSQRKKHLEYGFPLMGVHAQLDCQACHGGQQPDEYANTSLLCKSCHLQDYIQTRNPNHQTVGFGLECQQCHLISSANWSGSGFIHSSTFPLISGHSGLQCQDCHTSGFQKISTLCVSCHQNDFNSTTDPNHVAAKFSTVCEDCHTINGWSPASFDHNLSTFPLTGAHTSVSCGDCHSNGYTNTPSECVACHQSDFNTTTDPDHKAAQFPTTCQDCHSTTAWKPATFDHNQTTFPLTGAHTSVSCGDCHSNGYTNTPSECVACHQSDFNTTTDPDHKAAQFPTTCQDCHSTSAWQPANWDHDGQYFPIYSGKHRNEWNTCADCHVNTADYKRFECINCHEHNKSDTDSKHREVIDYTYESNACYSCHPNGKSDD